MHRFQTGCALSLAMLAAATSAWAGSPTQVGASGRTYASSGVLCLADPATGVVQAAVDTGLLQPSSRTKGVVKLNGQRVARLSATEPAARVWLPAGANDVAVQLNRRTIDHFEFSVAATQCQLPDTSGNSFSADGSLENAASGKSSATVVPGCALNPATGEVQPFVNLFANGNVLLNVSVNGVPLTQLGPQRPSTPVFLQAGWNVLLATNGSLSTDAYVRDAGDGSCTLPP